MQIFTMGTYITYSGSVQTKDKMGQANQFQTINVLVHLPRGTLTSSGQCVALRIHVQIA